MADTQLSDDRSNTASAGWDAQVRERRLAPRKKGYDPDKYWRSTEASYAYYPTVRHRTRFVLGVLQKLARMDDAAVFDYGCGEGTLLRRIQEMFGLRRDQIAGCDLSSTAVELAQEKLDNPYIYDRAYPDIEQKFNAIICSEVIEHTTEYERILQWIVNHLSPGGLAIVTTQGGRIHASDRYTGHAQHFRMGSLVSSIEGLGMEVIHARRWGFPLFTAQKYLTNYRFQAIRENYLDGSLTLRKRLVFQMAYLSYFIHDLIGLGPQIYVVARNPSPSDTVVEDIQCIPR